LKNGIPTIVMDEVPIESRDFTGGKARELFSELKCMGAVFVSSQNELLQYLNVSEEKAKTAILEKNRILRHLKPGSSPGSMEHK